MYTYAYSEETRMGRTISNTDSKYGSHSQFCNQEDHAFEYQLDQWGVERILQNSDEVIIRELKLYIEDWEKLHINNNSQLLCTMFLKKYGSLDMYDGYMKKEL